MFFGQTFELVADFVASECRQAVEAKLEYRFHLNVGELVCLVSLLRLNGLDESDIGPDFLHWPLAREQLFAGYRGRSPSRGSASPPRRGW